MLIDSGHRGRWQFAIFVTGDDEPFAISGTRELTDLQAAEVYNGLWATVNALNAAGHQVEEGVRIGRYRSQDVAEAVAELIELIPANREFHLAMRRFADDQEAMEQVS